MTWALVAAAMLCACSSSPSHGHAAVDTRLNAGAFKTQVQSLDAPFASAPLPSTGLSVAAAEYDGFAASVDALDVMPSQIGERATIVSSIHACGAALRAHPSLGDAQPGDYQACFTVQTLIDAMPS